MLYVIFAIFDKKVAAYGRPIVARTGAEAVRIFQDQVNIKDENNLINRYAADYAIYKIGDYDDEGAKLTGHEPQFLAEAQNLIKE